MTSLITQLRQFPYLQRSLQWFLPILLLVGLWVALTPTESTIYDFKWGDKVAHAVAFFGFAVLADIAWQKAFWLYKGLPLAAYGALIEILQGMTPYRSMDVYDFLADFAGILLYWLIARYLLKQDSIA